MDAISSSALRSALGERNPPLVLDVRRQPAYRESGEIVAGALRRDPDTVGHWMKTLPRARSVIAYCVHGHEVSQNVAKALDEHGIRARYLEGGIEAWKAKEGPLDRKRAGGETRWVKREIPKIDRIDYPWLLSCFVDCDAAYRSVPPRHVRSHDR